MLSGSHALNNSREYLARLTLRDCARLKNKDKDDSEHQPLSGTIQQALHTDNASGGEVGPAQ
jgi:hypothetical protein